MDPFTVTTTPIASSGIGPASVDVHGNLFTVVSDGFKLWLAKLFGENETIAGFITLAGFLGFLSLLWTIFSILSYLLAIGMLILYIYASVRKKVYEDLIIEDLRAAERTYREKYHGPVRDTRLEQVINHGQSDRPTDWRLAIIEADILLDQILKERGYAGNTLGERLRSISPQQLSTLNDAWEAHKVRNRIAHEGEGDFVLTKRLAQDTINRYLRVFNEFGL